MFTRARSADERRERRREFRERMNGTGGHRRERAWPFGSCRDRVGMQLTSLGENVGDRLLPERRRAQARDSARCRISSARIQGHERPPSGGYDRFSPRRGRARRKHGGMAAGRMCTRRRVTRTAIATDHGEITLASTRRNARRTHFRKRPRRISQGGNGSHTRRMERPWRGAGEERQGRTYAAVVTSREREREGGRRRWRDEEREREEGRSERDSPRAPCPSSCLLGRVNQRARRRIIILATLHM